MIRRWQAVGLVFVGVSAVGQARAEAPPAAYPTMAPIEQYRSLGLEAEVALARSAAPPSISADAEILVLGKSGYETAVKGKNGFVCFVERSWAASFADPEFWNPKLRAPNCFNAPAVRSELPRYLERTKWVLAGAAREELIEKNAAAVASRLFRDPEPGALSFMLSKDGYVSDAAKGPWLPHVMFFIPHGRASDWAPSLEGSPVIGREGSPVESTVLLVPVRRWSDGSPAPSPEQPHTTHKKLSALLARSRTRKPGPGTGSRDFLARSSPASHCGMIPGRTADQDRPDVYGTLTSFTNFGITNNQMRNPLARWASRLTPRSAACRC
jgi:hypothetical protein